MSENQSLIAIVQQANQLEDMLIQANGEITPEIEAALAITEISLPEKVDGYENVISRFEHLENFYKEKSQFFIRLQKQCANVQYRLKENIKFAMQTAGVDELKGNDVRYKLTATKGSLVIDDAEMVPVEYKVEVIETQIDKKKLKDAVEAGDVPGAHIEPGTMLRAYANTPEKKTKKAVS